MWPELTGDYLVLAEEPFRVTHGSAGYRAANMPA
jgi:hypothetical protein